MNRPTRFRKTADPRPRRPIGVHLLLFGQCRAPEPPGNGLDAAGIGHLDQNHAPDAAASGHQPHGGQVAGMDENPRAERKKLRRPTRLGCDDVGDSQRGAPHVEPGSRCEPHAVQQALLHDAMPGNQDLAKGSSRGQRDLSVKWIPRFHHPQPGQHRNRFILRADHSVERVDAEGPRLAGLNQFPKCPLQGSGQGIV
jgi:hypothetical protein